MEPLNIYCLGDSLTSGYYPYFLKGMLDRDNIPSRIYNMGIPGYNTSLYLRFLKKAVDAWLDHKNRISLLMLGTNDIRIGFKYRLCRNYRRNMETIINLLKARDFRIIISLIPPVTGRVFPQYTMHSIKRIGSCINPVIKMLAEKYGFPLADNYKGMSGQVFLDRVHPGIRGYEKMAENWYMVLRKEIKGEPSWHEN